MKAGGGKERVCKKREGRNEEMKENKEGINHKRKYRRRRR